MDKKLRITKKFVGRRDKRAVVKYLFAIVGVFLVVFFLFLVFVKKDYEERKYTKILENVDSINLLGNTINLQDGNNHFLKKRFEKEFFLTTDIKYQYKLWLKRTNLYFPYIEKRLEAENLPEDLKYVAVAESYLKKDASSSAGAGGIWQFISTTAQNHGLLVNEYVDERMNYQKATDAAISYFQDLKEKFDGDRFLVLAAYNMGENGLQRRIEEQAEENYFDLWLNEETRRYVFRVMAVKFAYENKEEFLEGFDSGDYYSFPDFEVKRIEKIDDIVNFVEDNNASMYEFKELNPWIKLDENELPVRDDEKLRKIRMPK